MILVTGGTGYIGSHTVVELINGGYEPIILDDLSNSSSDVITRIFQITGKKVPFFEGDVRDKALLQQIFSAYPIHAVIHFAGKKAVGESVENPLLYYDNNICGLVSLLSELEKSESKVFIFSSSATVYNSQNSLPFQEDGALSCTNPYGWTKRFSEQILTDFSVSHQDASVLLLRYFNPIGAHKSGLIGDNPNGIPNNLMPYISRVASGRLKELAVFGNDYPTKDGTGVRDYIHVVDLAKGHVAALSYALQHTGTSAINLGTGTGYSVLDVVTAFEQASGKKIPYQIHPRRPGDIAASYADVSKAKALLHWQAELSLVDMCKDSWNFEHRENQ